MQIPIFVEIKHLEHDVGLYYWRRLKERQVKVFNQIVHEDARILLTLGENVVEALVQEGCLVPEILPQVLLD